MSSQPTGVLISKANLLKSIVEAHNGTINVESTINQGTQFIIKLPMNS